MYVCMLWRGVFVVWGVCETAVCEVVLCVWRVSVVCKCVGCVFLRGGCV